MNYLAHIFLSGDDEELLIGNFIADFVRGNQSAQFRERIIEGIQLHRRIDAFTDAHPVVRQSVQRLRPAHGRYAAVVIDVFYDHFLAVNWPQYSPHDLDSFCSRTYRIFEKNFDIMPAGLQHFLPGMIAHNWLFHYSNFYGMERALKSIAARATFQSNLHHSLEDLKRDYDSYNEEFLLFFPDLVAYVHEQTKHS